MGLEPPVEKCRRTGTQRRAPSTRGECACQRSGHARELDSLVGNATRLIESAALNQRLADTHHVAHPRFGSLADLGHDLVDRKPPSFCLLA